MGAKSLITKKARKASNETPGDPEAKTPRSRHVARKVYQELVTTSFTHNSCQSVPPRKIAKEIGQEAQPRTTSKTYHQEVENNSIGNPIETDKILIRNR